MAGASQGGHRGHVFVEIVTAALPQILKRPFSRVVSALCVAICLVLVWYTWGATARAYRFGDAEMCSLDMPKISAAVPFTACSMALVALLILFPGIATWLPSLRQ